MTKASFIGLLGLKREAVVSVDGQSIFVKTDDVVGIDGLPPDFHLVTVRSHPNATIAVGVLVVVQESLEPVILQYDPQTEEVSSEGIDTATRNNLLDQVQNKQLPPTRLLPFDKIVAPEQIQRWKEETKFILKSNILKLRGVGHGDKIIPGCYQEDSDSLRIPNAAPSTQKEDGKSLDYPGIPVVDTSLSLRNNRHSGTKRYLAVKSPAERTQLFMKQNIASYLLDDVLGSFYGGDSQALLGDLQLSYSLFLYLHCLGSLEHWKDLLAMLALVQVDGVQKHRDLYQNLIGVLTSQIATMDQEFLEDVNEAGDNFLLPSLKRLCQTLFHSKVMDEDRLIALESLLMNKFPSFRISEVDQEMPQFQDDDDDDSDGPVVVGLEELQASLARTRDSPRAALPSTIQQGYPLLAAAVLPHEDIVMTCARVLDEKKDVTLVREAAAYLEQVEKAIER